MTVTLHVGAKVSKAKSRSVSVAILDGLAAHPEGLVWSKRLDGPGADPSPTAATMRALAEALALVALADETEVQVYSSSKGTIRAMDGTGGAKMDTVAAAYATAWSIYITRDLLTTWAVEYVPPKLLDDRVAAQADALFKAAVEEPAQQMMEVAA